MRSLASLQSNTRDANRPTPVSRARACLPPIDVGQQTSELARILPEGQHSRAQRTVWAPTVVVSHPLHSACRTSLAGDFNVIPTERDVYNPERWVDDALFRAETRDTFGRLMAQGWTDALRALHPDETIYTFWDYFRNAFQRNAGLRIDHLLLSPSIAQRLRAAAVDVDVRGWDKSSDHASVWIE
jgi:exodeoxyribonuclease III